MEQRCVNTDKSFVYSFQKHSRPLQQMLGNVRNPTRRVSDAEKRTWNARPASRRPPKGSMTRDKSLIRAHAFLSSSTGSAMVETSSWYKVPEKSRTRILGYEYERAGSIKAMRAVKSCTSCRDIVPELLSCQSTLQCSSLWPATVQAVWGGEEVTWLALYLYWTSAKALKALLGILILCQKTRKFRLSIVTLSTT